MRGLRTTTRGAQDDTRGAQDDIRSCAPAGMSEYNSVLTRHRLPHATVAALIAATAFLSAAGPLAAQATDSAGPRGAFAGRVRSSVDSAPARSVEIRLAFIDSAKKLAGDSLEIFVDSTRTRIGVTDSSGAFVIRKIAAGHYLMRMRRIGYEPLEGALTVGADTVRADFTMQVVSQTLAQVTITETGTDVVKTRLDRVGFVTRSHYGTSGTFLDRKDILRKRRDTLGELLSAYGIYGGNVVLDRMPLDYEDVRNYPAELVIGIEIYRHNRPTELNSTRRSSDNVFRTGGMPGPTVLVWSYIPGSH
jgi:hypothetical protein